MSDSYDNAIEDLKNEIAARMRMVNGLLKLQGKDPLFPDSDTFASTGSMKIRPDQFYSKGLSTAAREFLNMRKDSGPATLDEIYAALVRGSFKFDADEANAKPALKQSLTKNTAIFHRLPNGTYGLAEWYPGRKNGEEDAPPAKPRKGPEAKPVVRAKKERESTPPADPAKQTPLPHSPRPSAAGTPGSDGTPSLLGAVKEGIRSMPGEFTKQSILDWLNEHYPELKASDRRTSIFSMIAHLRDEMSLEVVQKGRGREPSIYHVAATNGQHN